MSVLKTVLLSITCLIVAYLIGSFIAFNINTLDAEKIDYNKSNLECDTNHWTDRFFLHYESYKEGGGDINVVWRCNNPVDMVGISNRYDNNTRLIFIKSVENGELYGVPYDNCSINYHLNIFTGNVYRKVTCK